MLRRKSRRGHGPGTLGVFAPLVGASVFKTSGGFEQSSQWIRFPYTPAFLVAKAAGLRHERLFTFPGVRHPSRDGSAAWRAVSRALTGLCRLLGQHTEIGLRSGSDTGPAISA